MTKPPGEWADPSGSTDPKAIDIAWEKAILEGLGDKSHALVEDLRPRVERLRMLLKQAQARGEDLLVLERRRTLEILEPKLSYQEAISKASAPARGKYGKALDKAVQAAEAAEAMAEAPVQELESARQTITHLATAAGVDTKELDSLLGAIDKALRAKLTSARAALTSAKRERDDNAAEIARLAAELDKLHRREAVA